MTEGEAFARWRGDNQERDRLMGAFQNGWVAWITQRSDFGRRAYFGPAREAFIAGFSAARRREAHG